MNILLLGGNNTAQTFIPVKRGFEQLGHTVRHVTTRRADWWRGDGANEIDALRNISAMFKPSLAYWYMCKDDCKPGYVSAIKSGCPNVKTVFHSFDDPFQIDLGMSDKAVWFDGAITCCAGSVEWYENNCGIPAAIAYPPFDDEIHGGAKFTESMACDFSFIGTNAYPKEVYEKVIISRCHIVRALAPLGTMRLYGYWDERPQGWGSRYGVPDLGKDKVYGGWLQYEEQPNVIASTAINLNSHVRPDGFQYLNERTLTICASGGFMLMDRVNGIDQIFEDGVHCALWGSVEELVEKAKRFLADAVSRQRIAEQGRKLVLARFNQREHAKAVLALVGLHG